jgi:hypothetical protein
MPYSTETRLAGNRGVDAGDLAKRPQTRADFIAWLAGGGSPVPCCLSRV